MNFRMIIFYMDTSVYTITSENWPRCCRSCFHQPFISSHGSGLLIDLPLDWVDCFGFIFRSEPAYLPSVNDHATMIAVNHTLIVMTSLLWSINWCICIPYVRNTYPPKDLFWSTDTCTNTSDEFEPS